MKAKFTHVLILSLAGGFSTASAEEPANLTGSAAAPELSPQMSASLSIDPSAPQTMALPGGLTPAFGQRSFSEGEWRFDFHGFITAPLNIGSGTRPAPLEGQSGRTLHTPPVVPDDLETFSHTGVVPMTYAQLNFSEGNSVVTGNVSILARQANVSTTFMEPASQLGITDVFLSFHPELNPRVRAEAVVGAFTSRYGTTGEWDEGRYGTPLIARINGVGERLSAKLALSPKLLLMLEQGFQGQSNKASSSMIPDVWNDFGNANEGTSFVSHLHAGLGIGRRITVGAHYIRAWSQDDRATGTLAPDGSIDIYAGDVRLSLGRFGHLYGAYSHTEAKYAGTVSRIISVLNTRGGQGLIDNYFGAQSGGNGSLDTVGGQFDISIGRLVSYPVPFSGDGPDLYVSVFGLMTHVKSDDVRIDTTPGSLQKSKYNDVTKRKFGLEATYSMLPWLALSGRFDQVDPNTADTAYSFAVVSPRIILRTDWLATNQVVLQYSHWFNGSLTTVRTGMPPVEDVTVMPDTDMVSLSASMWW